MTHTWKEDDPVIIAHHGSFDNRVEIDYVTRVTGNTVVTDHGYRFIKQSGRIVNNLGSHAYSADSPGGKSAYKRWEEGQR